tara:strand:+ start:304 stop:471 length:168 start_codon:yes stop_codon:yes gene_type:complete
MVRKTREENITELTEGEDWLELIGRYLGASIHKITNFYPNFIKDTLKLINTHNRC